MQHNNNFKENTKICGGYNSPVVVGLAGLCVIVGIKYHYYLSFFDFSLVYLFMH